ncbi:MAG: hypothetical protein AAF466_10160 [Bacteroidota bacterium]
MADFIPKYFWVLGIAITFLNVFLMWTRIRGKMKNPDLSKGYQQLMQGYLMVMIIPWLIMGVGITSGMAEGVFDFVNIRSDQFIVQTFFGYILGVWIVGFYWIFFRKGAEFIERHPGALQMRFFVFRANTAISVKIFYVLFLLGIIFVFFVLYNTNFGYTTGVFAP